MCSSQLNLFLCNYRPQRNKKNLWQCSEFVGARLKYDVPLWIKTLTMFRDKCVIQLKPTALKLIGHLNVKVFPIRQIGQFFANGKFFSVMGTDKDETPTPFICVLSLKPSISLFFSSIFLLPF